jgi:hypothetical protein
MAFTSSPSPTLSASAAAAFLILPHRLVDADEMPKPLCLLAVAWSLSRAARAASLARRRLWSQAREKEREKGRREGKGRREVSKSD